MASERGEWLAGLKPGDEVAVVQPWMQYAVPEIVKVSKVTPKQVAIPYGVSAEQRFWKESGCEVGRRSSWTTYEIQEPTPAIREKIERAELVADVEQLHNRASQLPLATLREVVRLLKGASPVTIEAEVSDGE